MTDFKEVRTTQHESGQEARTTTFKATQLVWLLFGILEAALTLRFLFKLIGVNAANPFASFVYGLTNIFVAPFASLTGAPALEGMVFEFSTLIAMFVYALVGWALERLIYVLFYRPRGSMSVKQTTVMDHTPPQPASHVSETTITKTTDSPTSPEDR